MANNSFNFKENNVCEYLDTSFAKEQEINQIYKDRKTGFKELDKVLCGLRPSLIVLASEPSNGKTTLLNQIADNLAETGETVLFFTLEQSRFELVAKSISRETFKEMKNKEIPETSLEIMQNMEASDLRKRAMNTYSKISRNIYIIEGISGMTVKNIVDNVNEFIKATGIKPIVMIDYLQKIKSSNEVLSERKQVDFNVNELKTLSSSNNIPVFVISSLNRASYNSAATLSSLKESGGIEYGADIVMILQLDVPESLNEKKTDEKNQILNYLKKSGTRIVRLEILKNKNGQTNFTDKLMYYATYNYFTEELKTITSEKKFGSFNKKN